VALADWFGPDGAESIRQVVACRFELPVRLESRPLGEYPGDTLDSDGAIWRLGTRKRRPRKAAQED